MPNYLLPNGKTLTEEEIEKRATEWENGTWDGHLVTVRVGRPRLSSEANTNLSFKCPESQARMISLAAKASGMKKSAFMRNAAIEKAREILSE
jgi:hypothetical protein